MPSTPNPFKMGKQQKRIVLEMCQHNRKIVELHDFGEDTVTFTLSDDDHNDYESLRPAFVNRLLERRLFTKSTFHPNLQCTVYEYRVAAHFVDELILILT